MEEVEDVWNFISIIEDVASLLAVGGGHDGLDFTSAKDFWVDVIYVMR